MKYFIAKKEVDYNNDKIIFHIFEWNGFLNDWWWKGAYYLEEKETIFRLIHLVTGHKLTNEEKMYIILTSDVPI